MKFITMFIILLDMVVFHPKVWRLVGFGSSIIGFICFALGSSFGKLFGRWNLLKIVVYCILSSMFSLFMLYANHLRRRFPKGFLLKLLVSFLVLVFTSLYSYYDDRCREGETAGKGYRSILSLISFGSFALISMSLSIQVRPGIEVGMSNFFLGCLVLGVMKKNFLDGVGVALLCFTVMSIRSYSDFRQQQHRRGEVVELDDIVVVRGGLVDETPQVPSSLPLTIHSSSSPVSTLRRRPVDLDSSSQRRASLELVNTTCPEPYRNFKWWDFKNTLSSILPRQISLKTLTHMSLSYTEFAHLLSPERNFTRVLRRLRFRDFWLTEYRLLPPLRLAGPDDE